MTERGYIERRPIVHIGWLIAEKRASALQYGPDWTRDEARRINDDEGWEYTSTGSMGHVIRHEAVHLSDEEFALAWAFSTLGLDYITTEGLPEPTLADARRLNRA